MFAQKAANVTQETTSRSVSPRRGRWTRLLMWFGAGVVTIAALLAVLTLTYFWRSPDYFPGKVAAADGERRMIPYAKYQPGHREPYVYKDDHVLVFGARHTSDPEDPQLDRIDREWRAFRPTVALVEGRLGFLAPGLMDPVEKYGEVGRVFALARRDEVRTYTWEISDTEMASQLAAEYPPERVALFLVLRPYFSNLRYGKPSSPNDYVADFLDRADAPALEGTIDSVADIDRIWQRDFQGEKDWRDVSDETALPGYLQDISDASNDARNRHLFRLATVLAEGGERVFVICGSSHAVLMEPAFRQS
jgi:hypothetical protein